MLSLDGPRPAVDGKGARRTALPFRSSRPSLPTTKRAIPARAGTGWRLAGWLLLLASDDLRERSGIGEKRAAASDQCAPPAEPCLLCAETRRFRRAERTAYSRPCGARGSAKVSEGVRGGSEGTCAAPTAWRRSVLRGALLSL